MMRNWPKGILFLHTLSGGRKGKFKNQLTVLYELLKREKAPVYAASSQSNFLLRASDVVLAILAKAPKYTVAHIDVYSGKSFYAVAFYAFLLKVLGKKVVMMLHGGGLPVWSQSRMGLVRRTFDRADVLVAPSPFLAHWLKDIGYQPEIISNVIELEDYPFRLRDKPNLNLFWMRKFHPLWNPEMAVRVAKELKGQGLDFRLYMAGQDDGHEQHCRQLVQQLGLQEQVEFVGFLNIEQKCHYGQKCDFYLHTNKVDNKPVSVLEACAMGMLVVASRVGGIPYLLEDGKNALIVEVDDHKAMAQAIVKLHKNKELAAHISHNAAKLASSASWTTVRQQWLDLYHNLFRNSPDTE